MAWRYTKDPPPIVRKEEPKQKTHNMGGVYNNDGNKISINDNLYNVTELTITLKYDHEGDSVENIGELKFIDRGNADTNIVKNRGRLHGYDFIIVKLSESDEWFKFYNVRIGNTHLEVDVQRYQLGHRDYHMINKGNYYKIDFYFSSYKKLTDEDLLRLGVYSEKPTKGNL